MPRALAATLLLATLAGLVFALWQRQARGARTPSAAALARAEAILGEELRRGDALSVQPQWVGAERWRFARLWQAKGMDALEHWVPGDPLDPWDTEGFSRLWVLATHGAAAELPREGLGTQLRDETLGPDMRLLLFRLPPSRTLFDARRALALADLRRVGPARGKEERCTWRDGQHRCTGPWWRSVSAGIHEVGDSRRRCIFAQPDPDGAVLRLRWPRLPSAGRELAGRFGNRLWAVRHEEGSDVRLQVRVGERVRHTLTIDKADFRWHRWRVPLRAEDAGKPVALEVFAAQSAWRQVCLDARVLGPPGAATPTGDAG